MKIVLVEQKESLILENEILENLSNNIFLALLGMIRLKKTKKKN